MSEIRRVIALGFFDGVHLGHMTLLHKTAELARQMNAAAAAITFDTPPGKGADGKRALLLSGLEDRRALMRAYCGIEEMIVLPFDDALRHMPWERFLSEELAGRLGAVAVVAGSDYRFGFRGAGTAALLREACGKMGMPCRIVDKVSLEGTVVSSTHVRRLLAEGNAAAAARFLGHPHWISGPVERGRGLGGTLGIPTGNLSPGADILTPAHGVYAARATTEDGEQYAAVTNIGVRPTVDQSGRVSIESWLLGFEGDLYGTRLRLALYDYLRPEQKFSSVEELIRAIHADAEAVRRYFETHGAEAPRF